MENGRWGKIKKEGNKRRKGKRRKLHNILAGGGLPFFHKNSLSRPPILYAGGGRGVIEMHNIYPLQIIKDGS